MTPAQLHFLLRADARHHGAAGTPQKQQGGVHDLLQFQSMRRA